MGYVLSGNYGIHCADHAGIRTVLQRYRCTRPRGAEILDSLVRIQLPCGGFQGGRIDSTPIVPVTFNTGQILIGLRAGVAEFGDRYRTPMEAAAVWLMETLDSDGCWRSYPTPSPLPARRPMRPAWGLFEAERMAPGRGFGDAGLRNVRWALSKQRDNGWFADNCLRIQIIP